MNKEGFPSAPPMFKETEGPQKRTHEDSTQINDRKLKESFRSLFLSLGMSEDAADIAAKGRE